MGLEGKIQSLSGQVAAGKADAKQWLKKYNDVYSAKLGLKIFPGSLNVILESDFFLLRSGDPSNVIKMSKIEYGGQRDILMKQCLVFERPAYIWRTENAEQGFIAGFDFRLVEIITDVHLRSTFSLVDGSKIEIKIL